jgi:hypothetical protein
MTNKILITSVLALAFAAAGCTANARVGYRATVVAPAPELVYVSPGVQVVADVDEPVFYADGVYWRYDGGIWYRSRSYASGWVVTTSVPVSVRRIDAPSRYVRVHASARGNGVARGPVIRDHREARRDRGHHHR